MFGTRELFDYFQCLNCGCLQIETIPADISRHYPPDYYSFQITPESDSRGPVSRWLQKNRVRTAIFGRGYKINALLRHIVDLPAELYKRQAGLPAGEVLKNAKIFRFSARFLDVGCGSYSSWLHNLMLLGFTNLVGVDPYISEPSRHRKITIYKADLGNLDGQFDLITFHHSLEHMPLQVHTLELARRLLAPNGTCLVRIPIVSSLVWEKYGSNWVELDAPRHFYLHSLKSIAMAANAAGLRVARVAYDSIPFEFYGSEQYVRDIPLTDRRSLWIDPESSIFSAAEIAEFERLAAEVNATNQGGRAGFYLQRLP